MTASSVSRSGNDAGNRCAMSAGVAHRAARKNKITPIDNIVPQIFMCYVNACVHYADGYALPEISPQIRRFRVHAVHSPVTRVLASGKLTTLCCRTTVTVGTSLHTYRILANSRTVGTSLQASRKFGDAITVLTCFHANLRFGDATTVPTYFHTYIVLINPCAVQTKSYTRRRWFAGRLYNNTASGTTASPATTYGYRNYRA